MNPKLFNYQLSIILLMIVCFILPLKAQINIGSEDLPKTFSILELTTKTKDGGLRLPQLKTSEREALNSELKGNDEARGLVVYDIDLNCLEFWNGNEWIALCADAVTDCSNTPFPDLNASYDFASGATIDDLITTIGDNVKIYDAATGGN
ncbi:MAG: hypothetical protein FWD60_13090, partial [Candidatus Azobacteroides sp.]|nr:hypothetical protein [Candidatus Azobacteroides sp.]